MKIEKYKKFVANLHDQEEYIIHIKNSKEVLNYEFVLKNVDKIIKNIY